MALCLNMRYGQNLPEKLLEPRTHLGVSCRLIRSNNVPIPVQHKRRMRLMFLQHAVNGPCHERHLPASEIQPDTLHAGPQGQNAPVFALAYLLGIQLMPRIRNWKNLTLYRPERTSRYEHMDAFFTDTVEDLSTAGIYAKIRV